MLTERISQIKGEIRGLNAQLASSKKQADINSRELSTVLPLFEKGFVNQQRVVPLHREAARPRASSAASARTSRRRKPQWARPS